MNRLWLDISTSMPHPEHLHGTRHRCESRRKVLQLGVQTAFLHAGVQEKVCVKTFSGYESLDATAGRPKVMKLKKSLYGLRQSLRDWLNTVNDSLRDMGFTATASDPLVWLDPDGLTWPDT